MRPARWRLLGVVLAAMLVAALAGCRGGIGQPSGQPTRTPRSSAMASTGASATASPAPTLAPTPQPSAPAAPSPSGQPSPGEVIHVVAAGDTLTALAARYDTTWQSVLFWNRAALPSLDPDSAAYDPNRLEIGWRLTIWPGVVVPFEAPMPTPAPPSVSRVIQHGDRTTPLVALTFDVGDPVDPFVSIMTWLRDNGVPATIFHAGRVVDSTRTDAGRQALAIIQANPDLFDLGNHGYLHPDMREWSAQQVTDDLLRAEAAFERYSDRSPRPLFRPPSGYLDAEVLAAAGSLGYRYTVLWDVDPLDWKASEIGGPTAQQIVQRVLDQTTGGSIVLLHVGRWETYEALPHLVAGLRSAGYELVTLSEMLGL